MVTVPTFADDLGLAPDLYVDSFLTNLKAEGNKQKINSLGVLAEPATVPATVPAMTKKAPVPRFNDVVVPQVEPLAAPAGSDADAVVPDVVRRSAPVAKTTTPHEFNPFVGGGELDIFNLPDQDLFGLSLDMDSILNEWDRDLNVFSEGSGLESSVSNSSRASSGLLASAVTETKPVVLTMPEGEFTRTRKECLERYRLKKKNRKFSLKVRYHLRKLNADRRPRYKGRFIKKGEVIPKE